MQTRHRPWTLVLAVVLTLTVPTLAHNAGSQAVAGAKFPDPKITFKKYTLPNGLEVILHQDKTVPLVAVNLWYHVGSGDEVPGKSGFAHLFEHMMFQGTKNTGEDKHFEILQQIGELRLQRLHEPEPHQLLRGRPLEPARGRTLARERADGLSA